jgi:hypothetical protein
MTYYSTPAIPKPPGFNTLAYYLRPSLASINMGPYANDAPADLYNGNWWSSDMPSGYSMDEDCLVLSCPAGPIVDGNVYGPSLATASTKSTVGNCPLLPYGNGFAHSVRCRVTPAQVGNWWCHWSLPIEHNQAETATIPGETAPTYLECDGEEGGAGVNMGEGVGMWGGGVIWTPAGKIEVANPYSDCLFDPSDDFHDYCYWYLPNGTMGWSIDGTTIGTRNLAGEMTPAVLAWINGQHAYQIFDANSSAPNRPYQVELYSWAGWTP